MRAIVAHQEPAKLIVSSWRTSRSRVGGHNGGMTKPLTDEQKARIQARYPKRSVADLVVGASALAVLVAIIGFVVIQGLQQSNPPVVAAVRSFEVRSPSQMLVRVTVQRPDPSVAATCWIFAQAVSFERVAESSFEVPPADEELVNLDVELATIKQATSVSIDHCSVTE